eukprot:CAMPEP_0170542876 /NCGR_PEP_ID=MMETSP0211-20121228/2171_1 /TAXON_ID=311385 /ORGANISM="Pseudokeronopsis sp., Strain OXSARD2" /LENGTH=87 /DNA_ID=CAMNT_0010846083 /DNA_START=505 /DNA_END=768 /DNA_ORIENTATION=-
MNQLMKDSSHSSTIQYVGGSWVSEGESKSNGCHSAVLTNELSLNTSISSPRGLSSPDRQLSENFGERPLPKLPSFQRLMFPTSMEQL